MVNTKVDPEVMETLKKVKAANDNRKTELSKLEEISTIKRELGTPDTELENFVQKSKIEISKTDGVLKKRGV